MSTPESDWQAGDLRLTAPEMYVLSHEEVSDEPVFRLALQELLLRKVLEHSRVRSGVRELAGTGTFLIIVMICFALPLLFGNTGAADAPPSSRREGLRPSCAPSRGAAKRMYVAGDRAALRPRLRKSRLE